MVWEKKKVLKWFWGIAIERVIMLSLLGTLVGVILIQWKFSGVYLLPFSLIASGVLICETILFLFHIRKKTLKKKKKKNKTYQKLERTGWRVSVASARRFLAPLWTFWKQIHWPSFKIRAKTWAMDTTTKGKELRPKHLKLGTYETEIDALYRKVKERQKVRLEDLAREFGVQKELVQEWAKILEEHKLIVVQYPALGSPILTLYEEEPLPEEEAVKV